MILSRFKDFQFDGFSYKSAEKSRDVRFVLFGLNSINSSIFIKPIIIDSQIHPWSLIFPVHLLRKWGKIEKMAQFGHFGHLCQFLGVLRG